MTIRPRDTDAALDIPLSPGRMAPLFLVSLVLAFGGALLIWRPESSDRHSPEVASIMGWLGLIGFGLAGALFLWQIVTLRGPVVTLSPEGLRDRRVSPDVVPWTAIRSVTGWTLRGGSFLLVHFKPGHGTMLRHAAPLRLFRRSGPWLPHLLSIHVSFLPIPLADLEAAAKAYLARHGTPSV